MPFSLSYDYRACPRFGYTCARAYPATCSQASFGCHVDDTPEYGMTSNKDDMFVWLYCIGDANNPLKYLHLNGLIHKFANMSHIAFTYHLVFATYNRCPTIVQEHERELYNFIYRFLIKRDVFIRRIGGMPDHVHLLCDIPPKHAVADVMKLLKIESSKFMQKNDHFPNWNGWSEGYGGFTVDASSREIRKQYILNQRHHHSSKSFEEEYEILLKENQITT